MDSAYIFRLSSAYTVVSSIGVVFIIIIGVPEIIHLRRSKDSSAISLSSFWIFITSLAVYSLFGLLVTNIEVVIADFLATIVFGGQMVMIVFYSKSTRLNKTQKVISYSMIGFLVFINTLFMGLIGGKIFGDTPGKIILAIPNSANVDALNILGLIANVVGAVLFLISYFPQVISGIKKRNLPYIPFSYMIVVLIYSALWSCAWAIEIAQFNASGNTLNLGIFSFQFIMRLPTFIMCLIQFIFWFIHHFELKAITGKKLIIWY
ncbi:hypothetical protein [[Mycoplasma] testudinis]|uniref:hypothetical protein n=1 Tax=[Mycoplasma] testudinis TaxID=33924 RepID=UPI0004861703|nr:hypothetical protein [[Mycoplasma] testudinis]